MHYDFIYIEKAWEIIWKRPIGKRDEKETITKLIEKACRKTLTDFQNQKSLKFLERKPLHATRISKTPNIEKENLYMPQESVKPQISRKKAFEGGGTQCVKPQLNVIFKHILGEVAVLVTHPGEHYIRNVFVLVLTKVFCKIYTWIFTLICVS